MERLILPDGEIIASGVWGEPAILTVRWQQNRNQGNEITLGCLCFGKLEIELFAHQKPDIPPETRLIYQENEVTRGVFYCQGLTRLSQNRWKLTALDAMHRFSRELTDFWEDRGDDTVLSLLLGLCDHCGVTTNITELPGGDIPVPRLGGYPAQRILKLLGQVAGRFFYIDKDENLCAGWYDEKIALDNFHHLTVAEFTTAPIQRVLLRQGTTDIGWAYPPGEEPLNTLILQGNPIFAEDHTETAERIFQQISTFSHTPFTCRLLPGQEIPPGCLVEFSDLDGVERIGAVMQWEKENGVLTVRGTGSHSLQSVQAFAQLTREELEGQMLSISRTAQGLQVSHQDLLGNIGALELNFAGVQTQVTAVEQSASALTAQTALLQQTAQGLSLSVSQMQSVLDGKPDREEVSQVTEHFQFDADGMTIQNSATGMGIQVSENQVQFLGGADPTTVIYPDAMVTTRLTVGKRLDLGDFSLLPRTNGNLSLRYTGIPPEEPDTPETEPDTPETEPDTPEAEPDTPEAGE